MQPEASHSPLEEKKKERPGLQPASGDLSHRAAVMRAFAGANSLSSVGQQE